MKISIWLTLLYTSALYAGGGDFLINQEVQINENGKITMSRYLGEIMVGDDILPIVMNFRSDMAPTSSSLVPKHEIPLLEAKAVTINENSSRVLLPNGNTLYLSRKSAKLPYEVNPPWVVKIDGSRLLLSDGDSKFAYHKGRIVSWQMASNKGLKWHYDVSGLKSLNDYRGVEILSIGKASQDLQLGYRDQSSSVNWEFIQVGEVDGMRWVPLMKGYSALDGNVFNFDSSITNSILTESVRSVNGEDQASFSYNYTSGEAVEFNGDKVLVTSIKGFSKPSVSVVKEGKEKLIHTAGSYGAVLDKDLLEDGSIKESSYLFTPTGRKLRKILLKKGGEETELYKAHYGSGGQLILDRKGKFTRKLIDGKFHVYKNNKLIREYK